MDSPHRRTYMQHRTLLCALLAGVAALAPPAHAAPDRSVVAGAQIPADAFAFAGRTSQSCTHHVATSGNDANSGSSLASAWRTPAKAFASLAPGQTACVHAGTYDASTLNPARSGTA